jgi:hypothetical protein
LGESGAGKSTIASLAENCLVLGDDMNVVFKENDAYFVRAGAIGGLFYPNIDYSKKYPIKDFYWIIKANENKIESVKNQTAASKLLASLANIFWHDLPKKTADQAFKFVVEISKNIPVSLLYFKKSSEIFDYVK